MCEYTSQHMRKLIGKYELDIASVKDGYQPVSLFTSIWCAGWTPAQTIAFLEERIAMCVQRIIELDSR